MNSANYPLLLKMFLRMSSKPIDTVPDRGKMMDIERALERLKTGNIRA
jgi:hypothetical protein